MDTVAAITDNHSISATGRNLGSVNALFQSMRRAFKVPRVGKLSDEIADDGSIHDRCSLIVEHMEVFLHSGIPSHIRTAAKIIMERYRRRERMLFANNA